MKKWDWIILLVSVVYAFGVPRLIGNELPMWFLLSVIIPIGYFMGKMWNLLDWTRDNVVMCPNCGKIMMRNKCPGCGKKM
jgi:hypothetical protein